MQSLRSFIKSLIPPIFLNQVRKWRTGSHSIYWEGPYSSWEEAQVQCTGYDAPGILKQIEESTDAVLSGKAKWERDTVLFQEQRYVSGFLAAWALVGVDTKAGGLKVLDFGGSMGSLYFQHKDFLQGVADLSWIVVEQKSIVELGQKKFSDGRLQFALEIPKAQKFDLLIISSSIQYLSEPIPFLQRTLKESAYKYILLDRVALTEGKTAVSAQHVTAEIYAATYPCWFFNESELLQNFKDAKFEVICEWPGFDISNLPGCYYKGFLLRLKA